MQKDKQDLMFFFSVSLFEPIGGRGHTLTPHMFSQIFSLLYEKNHSFQILKFSVSDFLRAFGFLEHYGYLNSKEKQPDHHTSHHWEHS